MLYWIYNAHLTLALVLGLPLIPLLALLGERFRGGLPERFGLYSRGTRAALGGSRPLWIHAASVGEVLAARPLVDALKAKFPARKILLSTFTVPGRDIARRTVAADAHVLLPLDHPWFIGRALALFEPSVLILMETELWPNLVRLFHRRGVPTLLVSGRVSSGSFRWYYFFRRFFSGVVGRLAAMGMQTAQDAERIVRLGADPARVSVTGNLKQASRSERDGARKGRRELPFAAEPKRRFVVAGSTHRGEEEILLAALRELKPDFPDLSMVLAPRHPQRFAEVERLLKRSGLGYAKRSAMNGGAPAPDVIFLDTMGELAAFYALADAAFVGGSLVDAGGHNVMEPARLRKPVLFGPHMSNFAALADALKRGGGAVEVGGKDDLVRELARLLGDLPAAEKIGARACDAVKADPAVIEASSELVARYL